MKNKIKFIIFSFMLLPIILLFVGCGNNHNILTFYESDQTHHWNSCFVQNCEAHIKNKEEHEFEFVSEIAPTCSVVGEKIYKCKVCNYEKVEEVPLVEHSAGSDYWDAEPTFHRQQCYMCHKEINKGPHNIIHDCTLTYDYCDICKSSFEKKACELCGNKIILPTINSNVEDMASSQVIEGLCNLNVLTPGQGLYLEGKIDNSNLTVDFYMALQISHLHISASYEDKDGNNQTVILLQLLDNYLNFEDIHLDSGIEGVDDVSAFLSSNKYKLYKVGASANNLLKYSASINILSSLPNFIEEDGIKYVFNSSYNKDENDILINDISININVKAAFIQADNLANTQEETIQVVSGIFDQLFQY